MDQAIKIVLEDMADDQREEEISKKKDRALKIVEKYFDKDQQKTK